MNGKFWYVWFRLKAKIKAWENGFLTIQEYVEYEKMRIENGLTNDHQKIMALNRKVDEILLELIKQKVVKHEA